MQTFNKMMLDHGIAFCKMIFIAIILRFYDVRAGTIAINYLSLAYFLTLFLLLFQEATIGDYLDKLRRRDYEAQLKRKRR